MKLPLYFTFSAKNMDMPKLKDYPRAVFFDFDTQEYAQADILIVTDSQPPPVCAQKYAERFIETVRKHQASGVFFDFEKPLAGGWVAFLQCVTAALPERFVLLPESYAQASSTGIIVCTARFPKNAWVRFCEEKQQKYESRWALELVPYQLCYHAHRAEAVTYSAVLAQNFPCARYYAGAMCMGSGNQGTHWIFDTPQTLRQRLDTAHRCGCRLAIGLWDELQYYF